MKQKTMLKVLLCFLIISVSIFSMTAEAIELPTDSVFFDAAYAGAVDSIKSDMDISPILHVQSLIMMFGRLIAVIVILVYGIQWAMANSTKRQELKAGLWPLTIGIILLVIGPTLAVKIYDAISYSGTLAGQTNTVAGVVINIVQLVGYIVAVVMVLILGIQWLTGNPSKRQELKVRGVNLIIGAILIAGGVTILGWIYDIADKDIKNGTVLAADTVRAYDIRYPSTSRLTITGPSESMVGENVSVSVVPKEGYIITGAKAVFKNGSEYKLGTSGNYSFTMPEANVRLYIDTKKIKTYDIKYPSTSKLTITGPSESVAGGNVSVLVVPKEGYIITGAKAVYKNGGEYKLGTSGNYSFTMPEANVRLYIDTKKIKDSVVNVLNNTGSADVKAEGTESPASALNNTGSADVKAEGTESPASALNNTGSVGVKIESTGQIMKE